jgi:hypothetical protein
MGLFGSGAMKPNGILGLMNGTPGFNPNLRLPQDRQQQIDTIAAGDFSGLPAKKKSGFNEPGGWAEKLAAIGAMLGGSSVPLQMRMQQNEAQQRAQKAEADRQAEWEDFQRKEQWKRDNPMPMNNDTVNDFNWYKGLTPGDQAIYDRMHPIVIDGPDGRYMVPRAAMGGQMMGGGMPAVGSIVTDPRKAGGPQVPPAVPFRR